MTFSLYFGIEAIAAAVEVIPTASVVILEVILGSVIGVNALVASGDWIESQIWDCFVTALVALGVLRCVARSNHWTL